MYSMVRKALLRNGILAARNVESTDYIEVTNHENKEIRIFQPDKEPVSVYSIATLLDTLQL